MVQESSTTLNFNYYKVSDISEPLDEHESSCSGSQVENKYIFNIDRNTCNTEETTDERRG